MEKRQNRRTKIVATLGPGSIPLIKELIIAGVNVFRLNFSHIEDPSSQIPIIDEIRQHSEQLAIPVGILGDLGGPKIRCNAFEKPYIALKQGSTINLVSAPLSNPKHLGNDTTIVTPIPQIVDQSEVGHFILLDDGYIKLKVLYRAQFELAGESVNGLGCEVMNSGDLKPKKGINCPDLKLGLSAVTEKDRRDAMFMLEKQLEFVALSFVQDLQDIADLRELFEASSSPTRNNNAFAYKRPLIIAKIEKPQALEHINEIIGTADGIMVARGDLGVEMSLEKVPIMQKLLISKCNAAEKVVITATQMMESMITNPSPTRAEVSDVANSVFDGTDAVMLSAETAVGKYPIEAVKMMGSICRTAENDLGYRLKSEKALIIEMKPFRKLLFTQNCHSIAKSAVFAAQEATNIKAIVAFTESSDMPIIISKARASMPILAITNEQHIYRKLSIYYGVYPIESTALRTQNIEHETHGVVKLPHYSDMDAVLAQAEKDILEQWRLQERHEALTSTAGKILEKGDIVVFCAGNHSAFPGLSQTVKLSEFGSATTAQNTKARWRSLLGALHPKPRKE